MSVADEDNICTVTKIELYHGDTLVDTADNVDERSFADLLSNNLYTVKATYTYDLNDGEGAHTESKTIDVPTLAQDIVITDIEIAGKTTLVLGEFTSLIIRVENPDGVEIKYFNINGISLAPTKISNKMYSCKYTPTAGGIETIKCDILVYDLFGTETEQNPNYTDTETLAILGTVSGKIIAPEKKYYGPDEDIIFTLQLEGAEDYDVKFITLQGRIDSLDIPLIKINDTTYTFAVKASSDVADCFGTYYSSTTITYGLGSHETTQDLPRIDFVYHLGSASPTIINVSTPEQLQNMKNSGAYYKLTQDIDLSGFDWQPYEFSGFLDGNGYSVKNLSLFYLTALNQEEVQAALFTSVSGYVYNLTLENASIVILNDGEVRCSASLLAVNLRNAVIDKCVVEGEITLKNISSAYGIIGASWSPNDHMVDSVFGGTITLIDAKEGPYNYVSIFGQVGGKNCTSYAEVTVNGKKLEPHEYCMDCENSLHQHYPLEP